MVLTPRRSGPDDSVLVRRVFVWALMVSAIVWTLAYQAGKTDPDLPEFVYVNF
jgi:hypothetical protein